LDPGVRFVSKKAYISLIVLGGIIPLCKLPYALILGLFFLIPKKKFGSLKKYFALTFLFILTVLILYSVSNLISPISLDVSRGDKPVGSSGQISFITNNPIKYVKTIVRTVRIENENWAIMYIGKLGWLDTALPVVIYNSFLAVVIFVALINQRPDLTLNIKERMVLLVVSGISFVGVITALYVIWTPVGAKYIEGVQGRYLIPIVPVFIVSFYNRYIPLPSKLVSTIVTLYVFIILSMTVFALIQRYYY
jgi:uncharacterized membrane protein